MPLPHGFGGNSTAPATRARARLVTSYGRPSPDIHPRGPVRGILDCWAKRNRLPISVSSLESTWLSSCAMPRPLGRGKSGDRMTSCRELCSQRRIVHTWPSQQGRLAGGPDRRRRPARNKRNCDTFRSRCGHGETTRIVAWPGCDGFDSVAARAQQSAVRAQRTVGGLPEHCAADWLNELVEIMVACRKVETAAPPGSELPPSGSVRLAR
jgi:hypothetical protein